MVIRSYTADSVASALKQVRSDMGGNAVVLKTRVVSSGNTGNTYEVTACLDKPTVEQADRALASGEPKAPTATVPSAPRVDLTDALDEPDHTRPVSEDRLRRIESKLDELVRAGRSTQTESPTPEPIDRVRDALGGADLPESCLDAIANELTGSQGEGEIDNKALRRSLIGQLELCLETEFKLEPGDRVLLAGPAGSGKSSLVGRLAAWLTFEKKTPVKLVSLDNVKVGAVDEIASYADLLGVDEIVTPDVVAAGSTLEDDDKVVLIDTCALPRDPEQLSELKRRVEALRPTHRLAVFSGLTRTSDILKIADDLTSLEPTHLAFTMTDLTDSLGAVVAGARALQAPVALITDSPSGADCFRTPDAELIANKILGWEVDGE